MVHSCSFSLPIRCLLAASLLSISLPAWSQDRSDDVGTDQISQEVAIPPRNLASDTSPGQTARSAAGQAGQRQTRERVAQDTGIEPMGRIGGRIQNRAQTRIRNRIDRYYDPQANATSPFVVAGEQARAAGRRRR